MDAPEEMNHGMGADGISDSVGIHMQFDEFAEAPPEDVKPQAETTADAFDESELPEVFPCGLCHKTFEDVGLQQHKIG